MRTMRTMRTMRLLLWVLPLALAACSVGSVSTARSTATPSPTATPTVTPMPGLVALTCTPPSPIVRGALGPEVQGTASPQGQQLWGLLQGGLQAKVTIKIVWRMTGSGGFSLVALGPQGQQAPPTEGPSAHLGSNWNDHPGDEWGSLFVFPTAGCWDIRATRSDTTGDVLLVVPS